MGITVDVHQVFQYPFEQVVACFLRKVPIPPTWEVRPLRESLDCPRLRLVVTGPNPQGSRVTLRVPLQSACCSRDVQGEGGSGFPQRLLSGMRGGLHAGHHVHIPPSSGGCGLRVASQGGLSSSAFWFISHFLNANACA